MSETHDYDLDFVLGSDLHGGHVLVGESGGLCAVYEKGKPVFGLLSVETEHGFLYLDAEGEYAILAEPGMDTDNDERTEDTCQTT